NEKTLFCFLPFLFLTACDQNVTEEDFLIGGTWVATVGYQDGEAEGEPNCYPFQDGIEFIDKDAVYIETYGRDENEITNCNDFKQAHKFFLQLTSKYVSHEYTELKAEYEKAKEPVSH